MLNFPVTLTTSSPDETRALGVRLARMYEQRMALPTFIAMYGDLGVGKTAFVSGFAQVLAPQKLVRSPSFSLVNEYRVKGKIPLFHFDMYRIESEDELYAIGYDDYLDAGICLCEWSEHIIDSLPPYRLEVLIEKTPEGVDMRKITMKIVGEDLSC